MGCACHPVGCWNGPVLQPGSGYSHGCFVEGRCDEYLPLSRRLADAEGRGCFAEGLSALLFVFLVPYVPSLLGRLCAALQMVPYQKSAA